MASVKGSHSRLGTSGESFASMILVFKSSDGGAKPYESGRQVLVLCTKLLVGVVLLSVFGGKFVLAKVSLGLISFCCTELRGVCFLEVRNVLVLWKNQLGASDHVHCREIVHFRRAGPPSPTAAVSYHGPALSSPPSGWFSHTCFAKRTSPSSCIQVFH